MRLRTGCLTCRRRKLKCGEELPVCARCRKRSRQCRYAGSDAFRHEQNPSIASGASPNGTPNQQSNAAKTKFNEQSVWMPIPKQISFVHVSEPHAERHVSELASRAANGSRTFPLLREPEHSPSDQAYGDAHTTVDFSPTTETTQLSNRGHLSNSPVESWREFNYATPCMSVETAESEAMSGLSVTNPRSSVVSDPDEGLVESRFVQALMESTKNAHRVESDHKEAFLLRHFAETVGHWMDLFDLNGFFASQVPMRALACPLLKSALCAYAAKQLARVRGCKAIWGGVVSAQARMENWPETGTIDWNYQAAKYYEKAIQELIKSLQKDAGSDSAGDAAPSLISRHDSADSGGRSVSSPQMRSSSDPDSEDAFAATAILAVYEFVSASGFAWNRHLNGARSLLKMGELSSVPEQQGFASCALTHPLKLSRSRRAIFWNFARQDYLAGFINQKHTLLDPQDIGLWRDAGLQIDEEGFVIPSNQGNTTAMREDMISNALVWLLAKIVNYVALKGNASSDELGATIPASDLLTAGHDLRRLWERLNMELEVWLGGLPGTFAPCARLKADRSVIANACNTVSPFDEIWYHIPMCASTMQNYHFARMVLLDHTPEDSHQPLTTVLDRLKSYQPIADEMRFHSYEICGISMSRLEDSVRCHALQPLFVAGKFLTDECERRNILHLLRGIEADLGWATEYRVQELLDFWRWRPHES